MSVHQHHPSQKNVFLIFTKMNFIILLIIVNFTKNSICLYLNSSLNAAFHSALNFQSRPKRAPIDYTRWKADFEPTEEFIVKVIDEDSPTSNSQVDIANINAEIPLRNKPDNAESVEIENDPNIGHLILNRFSKSNLGYNKIVPVYPKERIISQKTFKGNIDTKYSKVKYMSAQIKNQDALLGSRFLSKLDSPVQQFAPLEPDLFHERTSPPLLQIKSLSSGSKLKASRTSPKPDSLVPIRTSHTEKFSPLRTSRNERFSLHNTATDNFSPFQYIHPIRTTAIVKPLRKLNKLFNMRTGTTTIPNKETEDNIDVHEGNIENIDDKIDEDDESMEIKTSDNTEIKMIKSEEANEIQNECQEIGFDVTEILTDSDNFTYYLEKNISKDTQTTISKFARRSNSWAHENLCTVIKSRGFDNSPRTLHEIVMQLKTWAENSPVTKWLDITNGNYTTMENPIYMMMVDDLSEGQIASAKETVLIVAGIQGKDHHAVLAAMSLLRELIEKSETHSDLLRKYRFWIIPVLNPDGYDYSITFPLRRHWRKNLRQTWSNDVQGCQAFGINCMIQSCYGVNLDRNFEYQWIPTKELRAEHPCGPLFAGPRQLSEVETRALTQYLDKKQIYTFIVYKEGDVLGVLYPYSHTKKKRPLDNFYRVRAMRAATAASVAGGRTYVYGQTSEFLPLYAGGIEDWVDGHLGIDNTYSIMMMRRTDDKDSKTLMERVTKEAFAATHALLFPSDYDQSHIPLAMKYKNSGTQMSMEYIVLVTFFTLLGNV